MSIKESNTLQAFWIAMGKLSSFLLAIGSAAILSRYFGKEEYGTYRQVLYVYTTLLVVFSAGLPKVYAYFLPKSKIEEGKSIVDKVNRLLFILGFIFSVFIYISSDGIALLLNNAELAHGLKIFSPVPFFLLPTLGLQGILPTYKKSLELAIYHVISKATSLSLILLPIFIYEVSFEAVLYGWNLAGIASLGIALWFKNLPFKKVEKVTTTLSYKSIFQYSIPIVVASLAGVAMRSADQFFISRYFGTEVFAEYVNGFVQIPFVNMIAGATSVIMMPYLTKLLHNNESLENIFSVWQRTLVKSAILVYPIVAFVILNAKSFIIILYSDTYVDSAVYFQIAQCINFFNIILFAPLLLSMGKSKIYANLHIVFAVVAWIGQYILILLENTPISIAIFSVINNILLVLIALFYAARILNVNIFRLLPVLELGKLGIHTLSCSLMSNYFIEYLFHDYNMLIKLILSGLLYVIVLMLTAKLFKVDYLGIFMPFIKKLLKR